MTKPLALVFYERLLPGSQLANRLQDLGYRVHSVTDASLLIPAARNEKPMVAIVDLVTDRANVCSIIKDMRDHSDTSHIPVIGFAGHKDARIQAEASRSGATLVALDDALLPQLPHLLEHVLRVE